MKDCWTEYVPLYRDKYLEVEKRKTSDGFSVSAKDVVFFIDGVYARFGDVLWPEKKLKKGVK
jgi:hypothetical protein